MLKELKIYRTKKGEGSSVHLGLEGSEFTQAAILICEDEEEPEEVIRWAIADIESRGVTGECLDICKMRLELGVAM